MSGICVKTCLEKGQKCNKSHSIKCCDSLRYRPVCGICNWYSFNLIEFHTYYGITFVTFVSKIIENGFSESFGPFSEVLIKLCKKNINQIMISAVKIILKKF